MKKRSHGTKDILLCWQNEMRDEFKIGMGFELFRTRPDIQFWVYIYN